MIPIKEAINSAAWLHFVSNDEWLQFRLKILSFHKLKLSEVDSPEKVKITEGAIWWLMNVEFISLTKSNITTTQWKENILLLDQDDYKFNEKTDFHLGLHSGFSKKSGLNDLFFEHHIPKIKTKGAISFLLPDEDDAEYSIAMYKGAVREA